MEKKQLKECISILYDMEKNNYLMTRAIIRLDREISKLCHKDIIAPPKPKELKENPFNRGFSFAFPFGIIGAIIGGIIGLWDIFNEYDFLLIIFLGLFVLAVCAIIGGIIGAIIGFIVGLIVGFIKSEKEKQQAIREFDIAKGKYKKALRNEDIRIAIEGKQKDLLLYQKSKLIEKRRESKKLLDSFYNIVGIDKDFRSLIPMAYMDQFIRLGISSKLEGVDGLYYLTRKDLREDQIYSTLENIVEKLDSIIDNLKDIHNELKEINRKCDAILDETIKMSNNIIKETQTLNELKDKTEVLTYYAERNNIELKYQNYIMTFVR